MVWLPRDLSSTCEVHTNLTTCSSAAFVFLQLVVKLFGESKDRSNDYYDYDVTTEFSNPYKKKKAGDYAEDKEREREEVEEFDFIVVGAGSAGCVVANRLTEIRQWKVLLLEAGDEEPEVADVPAFSPLLQSSSIDWGYMTQSQSRSCLARPDRRCLWSRGKVMGGSSTINFMIYIRGSPKDYDEWAAMGNEGWSYRDVLPYFKKSEDNKNYLHSPYHGVDGELTVERFPYQDENVFNLLAAYRELGLQEFDQNSGPQIGTMLLQDTTRDGERLSTNGAFIRPIREKRNNLVVRPGAFVVRVLIDPETKTAYGVDYIKNGKLVKAIARKEVILSAGVFNTPKALMLSGVGPAKHLSSVGIEVLKDLPVGFNLHDHTTNDGVIFIVPNETSTLVSDQELKDDVMYYRKTHRGPLSATGTIQVNAFVQTKFEKDFERADIQYSPDAINWKDFITNPILAAQTRVTPLSYYNAIQLRPILLAPKSRGYVTLNTSDPVYGDPLIYANTFEEQIDLLRLVEGIKQSITLLSTDTFRKKGYRLLTTPLPACESYKFGTDEYWACVVTSYTSTLYHPVGTCKMGPKNDPTAVVDSELQVRGIKNLRVIDSSIIPVVPRGNTNAPTIMIGEKGSDLIKKKWLKSSSRYDARV